LENNIKCGLVDFLNKQIKLKTKRNFNSEFHEPAKINSNNQNCDYLNAYLKNGRKFFSDVKNNLTNDNNEKRDKQINNKKKHETRYFKFYQKNIIENKEPIIQKGKENKKIKKTKDPFRKCSSYNNKSDNNKTNENLYDIISNDKKSEEGFIGNEWILNFNNKNKNKAKNKNKGKEKGIDNDISYPEELEEWTTNEESMVEPKENLIVKFDNEKYDKYNKSLIIPSISNEERKKRSKERRKQDFVKKYDLKTYEYYKIMKKGTIEELLGHMMEYDYEKNIPEISLCKPMSPEYEKWKSDVVFFTTDNELNCLIDIIRIYDPLFHEYILERSYLNRLLPPIEKNNKKPLMSSPFL
jgi:hypothetical protein